MEGKMKAVRLYADWEPKSDFKLGPKDVDKKQTYLGSKVWRNPRIQIEEVDGLLFNFTTFVQANPCLLL